MLICCLRNVSYYYYWKNVVVLSIFLWKQCYIILFHDSLINRTVCEYIYIYIYVCVCIYIYIYIIYIHIYIIYIYICVYVCVCVCMYVCMYIIYVCMYVCLFVYMYIIYVYMYIINVFTVTFVQFNAFLLNRKKKIKKKIALNPNLWTVVYVIFVYFICIYFFN